MKIKRLAAAGVVATTLAGGAFAFANSLDVSSQTLASGSDAVQSACTALNADWTPVYDATSTSYQLDTITLSATGTCDGRSFKVTVGGASGATLAEYEGTFDADNTVDVTDADRVDASPTVRVDAADVQSVTAVITGTDV